MANEFIIRKGFISKSASTVQSDFTVLGNTTSNSFIVDGGNSSQFLKADGTLDNTNYLQPNDNISELVNDVGYITGFTNTTYSTSVIDSSGDAIIRLSGSDSSTDDVTLIGGDNITLGISGDEITLNTIGGELEAIDEGSGIGYRLRGKNPSNYGNIGLSAIDLSNSTGPSTTNGATGLNSFAVGRNTVASGNTSYAEGENTIASGTNSHAEGSQSIASGDNSHAENRSDATGLESHAQGSFTEASGQASHSEGQGTLASGYGSHAEGNFTEATGSFSHTEGQSTEASGANSHAEGSNTVASGVDSHTEGSGSRANKNSAHAEGVQTRAYGEGSHTEGGYVFARAFGEHSGGIYGTDYIPFSGSTEAESHPTDRLVNYGNGVDSENRDDAFTIYKNGAVRFYRNDITNITNTNKEGLFIYDSTSSNRPTIHNGTDWKQLAYVGDVANFTETDPTVPSHVKNITTTNISNWDTAYDDKINTITVTGDANKVITLTQQDGTTLTANFEDNNDGSGTDIKINALSFNDTNGILTATRDDAVTVTTDLDGRYSLIGHTHTVSDITDFPTNVSYFNNDAGYITSFTDSYTDGVDFNTGNGILSISRNNGLSNVTVDLDGRYVDLTTNQSISGEKTFTNDVNLSSSLLFDTSAVRLDRVSDDLLGNSVNSFIFNIDSNGDDVGAFILRSGGNERMRMASNGNVGIGTNNPGFKLDVTGITRIKDTTNPIIYFGRTNGVNGGIGMTSDTLMRFSVGTSGLGTDSKMVINSSGNVGIGTTSPSEKLTVSDGFIASDDGTFKWGNNNTIGVKMGSPSIPELDFRRWTGNSNIHGAGKIAFERPSNNSEYGFNFKVDRPSSNTDATTSIMWMERNGNVGIGTTNPQTKLHAVGDNPSSLPPLGDAGAAASIGQFSYGTQFSTLSNGKGYIQQSRTDGSTSVYDLLLQPQGGHIGIGGTNPAEKLTIIDGGILLGTSTTNQSNTSYIRFTEYDTDNIQGGFMHYDGSANLLHLGMHPTSDNVVGNDINAITIRRDNRNVGINITNPSEKLTVAGNIFIGNNDYFKAGDTWIRDNGGGISVISQNQSGGGSIFFRPQGDGNGTNEMTLDSSGNLIVDGFADFKFRSNTYYGNTANNPMIYFGISASANAIIHRASGTGQNFSWRTSSNSVVATLDADNGDFETIGDIYASIFYDTKNTGYFINPSQDSTIRDITTNNTRAFTFFPTTGTSTYLKLGSTTNSLVVNGDIVAFASSDKRLKKNIKNIDKPLDIISKIGGYRFEWNQKSHKETNKKDIGVIAQEIEAFLPEIVQTRSNGYKAVDYDKLTALLIEGMKEQQKNINKQEDRLNNLENRLKLLEK